MSPFGRARLAARPALPEEADLVAMALRRGRRFRALGLRRAPFPAELDGDLALRWRGALRHRRLRATLVFERARLVALAVDHGWDDDADRLRRLAVFALDGDGSPSPAVVRVVARELLASRRCRALRVSASELPLALGEPPGVALTVDGERWLQLDGEASLESSAPASPPVPPPATVSVADRRRLGAFAVRRARRAPDVPLAVRNPAAAHAHLLRSHRPWQRRFYPQVAAPEETDVIVVGGGVAGLTAAWALRRRRVLLLEVEDRLGGTAAAFDGSVGPFALGAHYDEAPSEDFGAELLALYRALDIARPDATGGPWRFVERGHDVAGERRKQTLRRDGVIVRDPWSLLFTDPQAAALRPALERLVGRLPLPTRCTPHELRDEAGRTFADWIADHGLRPRPQLERLIDTALLADFGGTAAQVSALAGLHYYANRPYLTDAVETFAPPQGIGWYVERLRQRIPQVDVRWRHLVRRVVDRGDVVEVEALDLEAATTRRLRARQVVVAAPKHQVKHLVPADRELFAANRYAAWITVTLELQSLPESDLLCWSNTVESPLRGFVGMTWANHAQPDAPPQLTHYFVFPPGRLGRVRALLRSPASLVRAAIRQSGWFLHRDVTPAVRSVVVQKLGHAMPVPAVGVLLADPNARRHSERIVYAGVDTGRLPLVAEAFDSGLQAAAALGAPPPGSEEEPGRQGKHLQ